MPQEQFEGKEYQKEGISAAGRAFLEALARRKEARGEEVPPLYRALLEAPPRPLGNLEVGEALPRPAGDLPRPVWAPESPLALADRLLALGDSRATLPPLSPRARRVYRLLLALGLAHLRRQLGERPLPRSLSQLTLFLPNEALGVLLPPASLYRVLGELAEKGLIRRRAWRVRATVHGRTGVYAAGTLYALRLPHRERRPRLEREDFLHPWRDLEGDIARGRTAWRAVRESKESPPKEDPRVLEFLLGLSLPPQEAQVPLSLDTLTALLRTPPPERRRRVEELALGLAREFRDPGSVPFYAFLLWGVLRAELYGFHPRALEVLLWAVGRVREALAALWGSRRRVGRPGALLAHLLKEGGLLSVLQGAPRWRVA